MKLKDVTVVDNRIVSARSVLTKQANLYSDTIPLPVKPK